jgi:hypothetical protein
MYYVEIFVEGSAEDHPTGIHNLLSQKGEDPP